MHRATIPSANEPWERPLRPSNPSLPAVMSRRGDEHTIPRCPMPITSPTRRVMMGNHDNAANDCWSTSTGSPVKHVSPPHGKPPIPNRRSSQSFDSRHGPATSMAAQAARTSCNNTLQRNEEMPRLYPDLDEMNTSHSAKRASTLSLMDAHRRQRMQGWSRKLCDESEHAQEVPIITSPSGRFRRMSSFSKVQNFVEDQRRAGTDSIPRQVDVDPQQVVDISQSTGANSGLVSGTSLDDDDEDMSRTPSFYCDLGGFSSHHERKSFQSVEGKVNATFGAGGDDGKAIPKALDKSYIKNLASKQRCSVISKDSCSTASSPRPRPQQQLPARAVTMNERPTPPASPMVSRTPRRTLSAPMSTHRQDLTMVEVWPGLSAPLRGSDETMTAVARRFYTSVVCFGCTTRVYCIADVQFTICPVCRVISPVDHEDIYCGKPITDRWGLGLGFTSESLWNMQRDLASRHATGSP